jgi:CelD/BcsL family acetyltransferase involved in cellulose biosynthesis
MTVGISTDPAPVAALEDAASAIASARRAALADRYAANSFTVEWRPLSRLEPIATEWRELAARALEPNVFYEPAFALAAAPVFGADAGAILIWAGGKKRRLLGFFPARIERRRYGINLPVLTGWTHPYAPLGLPLVEREAAEPIIGKFLSHLAAEPTLPGLVLLPYLPDDGLFAGALDAILRRAQMPATAFGRHQRAQLAPAGERSQYLESAMSRHQRKELRRLWRRLAETGAIAIIIATEPSAIDRALEDFFRLEAQGWKGKAGTAAAGDEKVQRFVRNALFKLAAEQKVSINRLLVDGRAIAATIALRSGRSAWFWKIAYDEDFARFSPGVMLSVELTADLLDDPNMLRADSCATADHPMIDHLWRQRLPLSNRLIGVRGGPTAFAVASRLEGLRAGAVQRAKRLRGLLKGPGGFR